MQLCKGRWHLPTLSNLVNPKSAGLIEPVVPTLDELDVFDRHTFTKGDEGQSFSLNMEVREDSERFGAAKKRKFSSLKKIFTLSHPEKKTNSCIRIYIRYK